MMEIFNAILGAISFCLGLITYVFPYLKFHQRIDVVLLFCLVGLFFFARGSNFYQHMKYFDEDNFVIDCVQIPPIIKDGNTFYSKYALLIGSEYPEKINIERLNLTFNTSYTTLTSFEVKYPFHGTDEIRGKISEKTRLFLNTEKLKGKQYYGIEIKSELSPSDVIPFMNKEDFAFIADSATVVVNYKLFGKKHRKERMVNAPVEIFNLAKKDIVVDEIIFIDPNGFPSDLPYRQYTRLRSGDNNKSISILGLKNKPIILEYNDSQRIRRYNATSLLSERKFLRIVLNSEDSIIIRPPFPFEETYDSAEERLKEIGNTDNANKAIAELRKHTFKPIIIRYIDKVDLRGTKRKKGTFISAREEFKDKIIVYLSEKSPEVSFVLNMVGIVLRHEGYPTVSINYSIDRQFDRNTTAGNYLENLANQFTNLIYEYGAFEKVKDNYSMNFDKYFQDKSNLAETVLKRQIDRGAAGTTDHFLVQQIILDGLSFFLWGDPGKKLLKRLQDNYPEAYKECLELHDKISEVGFAGPEYAYKSATIIKGYIIGYGNRKPVMMEYNNLWKALEIENNSDSASEKKLFQ